MVLSKMVLAMEQLQSSIISSIEADVNVDANVPTRTKRRSKRRSSLVTLHSSGVDTKEKQDLDGPMLIPDRESHTADLVAFDRYVARVKERDRHELDGPCCEAFWAFLREELEKHGQPIGYGPHPDGYIVQKGPQDNTAMITKKFALDPFSPINPAVVADMAGLDPGVVLTELSHATLAGLTSVKFTPECTRCGGAVCEEPSLNDIVLAGPASSASLTCAGCGLPNYLHSLDDIAVVFFLDPQVLYVLADGFGCKPSQAGIANCAMPIAVVPGTSSGSGFRYSVGCGGSNSLGDALPKGRYRMHCPIARTDNYLEVLGDVPKDDTEGHTLSLNVSDLQCCKGDKKRTVTVPHGAIHFDIIPDTKSLFALWVQHDMDDDAVFGLPDTERLPYSSAGSVLNHPTFNRLLCDSAAIFVTRPNLEIRNVVLVFTDVVGSTDMYAKLGDAKALELVDRHFEILFGAFGKYGRVVKTVGDAVMASFPSGSAAIKGVAAALANVGEACRLPDGGELQIRVGINKGPAILIPLNGIVDYFGQTVNVAARVEGQAEACSCLVTEEVLSDPDAAAAYKDVLGDSVAEFVATPQVELKLKGVERRVKAKGFRHIPQYTYSVSDLGFESENA